MDLRPDQIPAVAALVRTKAGVLKAPAGSGKTVIGAAAIKEWIAENGRNPQVIWFAHTTEQCEQAKSALWNFGLTFSLTTLEICCYQSGKSCKGYDIVVLDECHHIASPEFRKILDGYEGIRWGLSATPDRADELKDDVYTLIGPIVYEVPRNILVEAGHLAHAKVQFHTPNEKGEFEDPINDAAEEGFERMKFSVKFHAAQMGHKELTTLMRYLGAAQKLELMAIASACGHDDESSAKEVMDAAVKPKDKDAVRGFLKQAAEKVLMSRAQWHACQNIGVFDNAKRNRVICHLAEEHHDRGDSILILVGSIEHGKQLAADISPVISLPGAVVIHSKMGAKKRKKAIEDLRSGALRCAIATSLADEGLDVPRVNVIILAGAGRSDSKSEQRTGRALRPFADKDNGFIHDMWDWQYPMLLNQSRARARVYKELGYEFVGKVRPKGGLTSADLLDAKRKLEASVVPATMIDGVPHFTIDPNAPRFEFRDGEFVPFFPVPGPPNPAWKDFVRK